jgi:rod shape determining protein RodA
VVIGANYFINDVLQPHQQNRIKVLVQPGIDPLGVGWNVTQSKNAIGSGGFLGKGYLQGTQTKFDFVPEQSTDFIFCTIGEEFGFMGSVLICGLFLGMLWRIIYLADRQKMKFSRVYGYCVAAILFFHFTINIGMTVGLLPVIGIPLPFFSYGGSSLWAFTIMLFILLKLDAHRGQVKAAIDGHDDGIKTSKQCGQGDHIGQHVDALGGFAHRYSAFGVFDFVVGFVHRPFLLGLFL